MTKTEVTMLLMLAFTFLALSVCSSPAYNRIPKELHRHNIQFLVPTPTIDPLNLIRATNDIDG